MIDSFTDEYAFLSNFYPSPVRFFDTRARTVEHAYQAAKTTDATWRMRILAAESPGRAKRLGRKAPLRSDWDGLVKDGYPLKVRWMRELLERKFSDPRLDALLTCTQPHVLVEGNNWADEYWGACWRKMVTPGVRWAFREETGESLVGLNMLGRLLMQIRDRERG